MGDSAVTSTLSVGGVIARPAHATPASDVRLGLGVSPASVIVNPAPASSPSGVSTTSLQPETATAPSVPPSEGLPDGSQGSSTHAVGVPTPSTRMPVVERTSFCTLLGPAHPPHTPFLQVIVPATQVV